MNSVKDCSAREDFGSVTLVFNSTIAQNDILTAFSMKALHSKDQQIIPYTEYNYIDQPIVSLLPFKCDRRHVAPVTYLPNKEKYSLHKGNKEVELKYPYATMDFNEQVIIHCHRIISSHQLWGTIDKWYNNYNTPHMVYYYLRDDYCRLTMMYNDYIHQDVPDYSRLMITPEIRKCDKVANYTSDILNDSYILPKCLVNIIWQYIDKREILVIVSHQDY